MVNILAMRDGLGSAFGFGHHVMSVFEKRLKPNTIITTPNCDVIYGLAFADLAATGPLVVEAPPGIQGLVDDFWHRPLTGPVIDGVRYLSIDDLSPGVASIEGIRLRPLRGEDTPMVFAHASDTPADALYPRDASFFDKLDAFIRADRVDQVDPYMHGVLAALGIAKGRSFEPTPRRTCTSTTSPSVPA